jgi:hypothetical protein
VQTVAEATDVEMPGPKEHETKVLDIDEFDALVLVSMVLDKVPDAMSLMMGLKSSAMMSLSGHFFLGFGLSCF